MSVPTVPGVRIGRTDTVVSVRRGGESRKSLPAHPTAAKVGATLKDVSPGTRHNGVSRGSSTNGTVGRGRRRPARGDGVRAARPGLRGDRRRRRLRGGTAARRTTPRPGRVRPAPTGHQRVPTRAAGEGSI